MYQKVTDDMFCIAKRLKTIDSRYQVFFNGRDARWEVHTDANPCLQTLAFVVPYDVLDERTLEYARKTRIENSDETEREVHAHNAELEHDFTEKVENCGLVLADMLSYAAEQNEPVTFTGTNKWF